ncbi:MAG: PAS domain S-box protein [Vicinamibacteria bacterium]|nr:PAS domain S-box protein [Vicinamibacteria bacterium]
MSLSLLTAGWLSWTMFRDYRFDTGQLQQVSHMEELRGQVLLFDEVLTMSALMSAATGDPQWEARYRRFEPQLTQVIKEAMRLAPATGTNQSASQMDAANTKLVEMENRAFDLVRQGQQGGARRVLSSEEYGFRKKVYAAGMAEFSRALEQSIDSMRTQRRVQVFWNVVAAAILVTLLVMSCWAAMQVMSREQLTQGLQRQQADQTLRVSEVNYRTLIESAAVGIFALDAQGRIDDVNGMACRMLGYTREELLALSAGDLIAAEDVARVAPALASISAGEVMRSEWQLRRKDGMLFPGEVSATTLPGGRTLAIVRDITERKQADAKLRLQSAALNFAAHSIVITDRNGAIEWVNPAFTIATGYTAEEVMGQNPSVLKSGVHDGELYKDLWNTILTGKSWRRELTNRRKGGDLIVEDTTITPVKNASGEITNFIAIKQDLTGAKQLEAQFRQAQKMESVGHLAGGIAHDFNNLLTVINGMSDLVLEQVSQDDPVRADVQEIRRAGERAATLTRQLLAFSRQQILEPRVLNVNTVVEGMESLLRRLLGEDIGLVVVPAPGLGSVKADAGQLEQVITNLAVNARDAMPNGGQLTIETQNVTTDEHYGHRQGVAVPPGPYVILSVSDSGVGMDEATRARIFEPFFTTKGPGKGTGLGLSTVYGIVKQSEGFIWTYSEVGQGTSFKIHLPRVAEATGPHRLEPTVVSGSGTETILLVEDNAGLRTLAMRFLKPMGYTVLGAATGEEALRLLERHEAPVHLLISDVVMPGMSGRELAARLAQTRPAMKVLYMSGYTSDTIVRHGVLDGKMPFLSKPFSAAALREKVRDVLNSQT